MNDKKKISVSREIYGQMVAYNEQIIYHYQQMILEKNKYTCEHILMDEKFSLRVSK